MTLSYDGHDLESLFTCGDPKLSILNSQPELMDVSARNGAAFIGSRYGTSTVTFTIAATGTAAERRNAFSTLGAWLAVDSPKRLILPDTPDRYYLAVPQGALELQRGIDGEYAPITFTLTDPVAYSVEEHEAFSAANLTYTQFTVGGTAPTGVVVECGDAYTSSHWWEVRAESSVASADKMSAYIGETATSSSSTTRVVIDSVNHTATYGGTQSMLSLNSTWFTFEPGTHKIYRIGGGNSFTVKWRDRWY